MQPFYYLADYINSFVFTPCKYLFMDIYYIILYYIILYYIILYYIILYYIILYYIIFLSTFLNQSTLLNIYMEFTSQSLIHVYAYILYIIHINFQL